jgi:glycosyltransferase involved in cell wall biosynthesis
MINTCRGASKAILDEAYARIGLGPENKITDELVRCEREELGEYDYFLSPNPRVEESLIDAGIDRAKVLRSSYGWSPASFGSGTRIDKQEFRALFIGRISVRKGIPQLLAAWRKSGVAGELLLVGPVEEALKPLVGQYLRGDGVRLASFDLNLEQFYKSSDIFVFPSLEEGDPLVTYEAAGCGLPVVATSMGSANIIKHGVNGFVVPSYDVDALAQAISDLASSPALRNRLAVQATRDAQNFTTDRVGHERARILRDVLTSGDRAMT